MENTHDDDDDTTTNDNDERIFRCCEFQVYMCVIKGYNMYIVQSLEGGNMCYTVNQIENRKPNHIQYPYS